MSFKQKGSILLTLSVIIVITSLAFIAGIVYMQKTSPLVSSNGSTTTAETVKAISQSEKTEVATTIPTNSNTSASNKTSDTTSSTGKITCALNDIDCLAKASLNCTTANLRTKTTTKVFSALISLEEYQEIEPGSNKTCVWSKVTNNYNLSFTPEYRQSLLSQMSEAEVRVKEAEAAEQGRSLMAAKDVSCVFASGLSMANLFSQIKEASQGNFNFSGKADFSLSPQEQELAQARQYASQVGALSCSGSLFKQP